MNKNKSDKAVRTFVIPEGADLRSSDVRCSTDFLISTGRVTLPGGGRKVQRPAIV